MCISNAETEKNNYSETDRIENVPTKTDNEAENINRQAESDRMDSVTAKTDNEAEDINRQVESDRTVSVVTESSDEVVGIHRHEKQYGIDKEAGESGGEAEDSNRQGEQDEIESKAIKTDGEAEDINRQWKKEIIDSVTSESIGETEGVYMKEKEFEIDKENKESENETKENNIQREQCQMEKVNTESDHEAKKSKSINKPKERGVMQVHNMDEIDGKYREMENIASQPVEEKYRKSGKELPEEKETFSYYENHQNNLREKLNKFDKVTAPCVSKEIEGMLKTEKSEDCKKLENSEENINPDSEILKMNKNETESVIEINTRLNNENQDQLESSNTEISRSVPPSKATLQNAVSLNGSNITRSSNAESYNRVIITLKHENQIFSCVTCTFSTKTPKGFEEHIATHIMAKPYICINCMKRFKSKSETLEHGTTVHPDKPNKCAFQVKNMNQIISKLSQSGSYTFKGISRKASSEINTVTTSSLSGTSDQCVYESCRSNICKEMEGMLNVAVNSVHETGESKDGEKHEHAMRNIGCDSKILKINNCDTKSVKEIDRRVGHKNQDHLESVTLNSFSNANHKDIQQITETIAAEALQEVDGSNDREKKDEVKVATAKSGLLAKCVPETDQGNINENEDAIGVMTTQVQMFLDNDNEATMVKIPSQDTAEVNPNSSCKEENDIKNSKRHPNANIVSSNNSTLLTENGNFESIEEKDLNTNSKKRNMFEIPSSLKQEENIMNSEEQTVMASNDGCQDDMTDSSVAYTQVILQNRNSTNLNGSDVSSSSNTESCNRAIITLRHQNQIFSCVSCNFSTKTLKEFEEDIATHIMDKPCLCVNCMRFGSKSETLEHGTDMHLDKQNKCALQVKNLNQLIRKPSQNSHSSCMFKGIAKKPALEINSVNTSSSTETSNLLPPSAHSVETQPSSVSCTVSEKDGIKSSSTQEKINNFMAQEERNFAEKNSVIPTKLDMNLKHSNSGTLTKQKNENSSTIPLCSSHEKATEVIDVDVDEVVGTKESNPTNQQATSLGNYTDTATDRIASSSNVFIRSSLCNAVNTEKSSSSLKDANTTADSKKKVKSKGLFARVGSRFVCKSCNVQTDQQLVFTEHVWHHLHVKKKVCKKCPRNLGPHVINCKIVSNVMNGLKFGSASSLQLKEKKNEHEPVIILDEEDENEEEDTVYHCGYHNCEHRCLSYTNMLEHKLAKHKQEEKELCQQCGNFSIEYIIGGLSCIYCNMIVTKKDIKKHAIASHFGMPKYLRVEYKPFCKPCKYTSFEIDHYSNRTIGNLEFDNPTTESPAVGLAITEDNHPQGKVKTKTVEAESPSFGSATSRDHWPQSTEKPPGNAADSQSVISATVKINLSQGKEKPKTIEAESPYFGSATSHDDCPQHLEKPPSNAAESQSVSLATAKDGHSQSIEKLSSNKRKSCVSSANAKDSHSQSSEKLSGNKTKSQCVSSATAKYFHSHCIVNPTSNQPESIAHENQPQCVEKPLGNEKESLSFRLANVLDKQQNCVGKSLGNINSFQRFECKVHNCKYKSDIVQDFRFHTLQYHKQQALHCLFCKRSFTTISETVMHCGENVFQLVRCPHCSFESTNMSAVINHVTVSHQGKPKSVKITTKLICKAEQDFLKNQDEERKSKSNMKPVKPVSNKKVIVIDASQLKLPCSKSQQNSNTNLQSQDVMHDMESKTDKDKTEVSAVTPKTQSIVDFQNNKDCTQLSVVKTKSKTEHLTNQEKEDNTSQKQTDDNCDENSFYIGTDNMHRELQSCFTKLKELPDSYCCKICDNVTRSKYKTHKHLLKHMNVWVYRCGYCNYKVLEISKLYKHIKKSHKTVPFKHTQICRSELIGVIRRRIMRVNTKLSTFKRDANIKQPPDGDCRVNKLNSFLDKMKRNLSSVGDAGNAKESSEIIIIEDDEDFQKEPEDKDTENNPRKNRLDGNLEKEESPLSHGDEDGTEDKEQETELDENDLGDRAASEHGTGTHLEDKIILIEDSEPETSLYDKCVSEDSEGNESESESKGKDSFEKHREQESEVGDYDKEMTLEDPVKRRKKNQGPEMKNIISERDKQISLLTGSKSVYQQPCSIIRKQNDRAKAIQLGKIFKCSVCSYKSSNQSTVYGHLRLHKNNLTCPLCSFSTNQSSALQRHLIEIHNEKKYAEQRYKTIRRIYVEPNKSSRPLLRSHEEKKLVKNNTEWRERIWRGQANKKIVEHKHTRDLDLKSEGKECQENGKKYCKKELKSPTGNKSISSKVLSVGRKHKCEVCGMEMLNRGAIKRHNRNVCLKNLSIKRQSFSYLLKNGNKNENISQMKKTFQPYKTKKVCDRNVWPTSVIKREGLVYKCSICGHQAKTIFNVKRHVISQHAQQTETSEKFSTWIMSKIQKMGNVLKCVCGITLSHPQSMRLHIAREHPMNFENKAKEEQTSRWSNNKVNASTYTCKTADKNKDKFRPGFVNHSRQNMSQIICIQCGFVAKGTEAFQVHCNYHHTNKVFACAWCTQFSSTSILHLKTHTKHYHRNKVNLKFYIRQKKENKLSDTIDSERLCYSSFKNPATIVCKECGYIGLNMKRFNLHCYNKHHGKFLLCVYCRQFKGKTTLELVRHTEEVHGLRSLKFLFVDSSHQEVKQNYKSTEDEQCQSECWYTCHLCSCSTNDIHVFGRHLACHETFTHVTLGQRITSSLIHNLPTDDLTEKSMFLCSYCNSYEQNLIAMKQHVEQFHSPHVFDSTRVIFGKSCAREAIVNLKPRLVVKDICEAKVRLSPTKLYGKCKREVEDNFYSSDHCKLADGHKSKTAETVHQVQPKILIEDISTVDVKRLSSIMEQQGVKVVIPAESENLWNIQDLGKYFTLHKQQDLDVEPQVKGEGHSESEDIREDVSLKRKREPNIELAKSKLMKFAD